MIAHVAEAGEGSGRVVLQLGPQLSGIVASYPVIVTVVGSFTHHQWGRDAVLRILRGMSLSLIGFVLIDGLGVGLHKLLA